MNSGLRLKEVMTDNPAGCEPAASLVDVGRLLIKNRLRGDPVVDDRNPLPPGAVMSDPALPPKMARVLHLPEATVLWNTRTFPANTSL